MQCKDVKDRLLDLLAGAMSAEEAEEVEEHLRACRDCREEQEALDGARGALRGCLDRLAPRGPHLTRARREKLEAALEEKIRSTRILTIRRFVGAAAAAAILVSCIFIYQDVRSMLNPEPVAPVGAGIAGGSHGKIIPVRVHLSGWAGPGQMQSVQAMVREPLARSGNQAPARTRDGAMVLTKDPDLLVPISNDFYDSEQDGYWW